jgi:hypothetical protein
MHNNTQPGDMVAFRRGDHADSHALVLEVIPQGEKLRVTHGSAHESELVNMEDVIKLPMSGATALHKRLAFSVTQVAKILAEKDQWAEGRIDNLEGQRDQYAAEVTRANTKLANIRTSLIEWHEEGVISRTDLDAFLDHHDMEPYSRRWTGSVTLVIELEVDDAGDLDEARRQIMDWSTDTLGDNEDISNVNVRTLAYDLVKDLT